MKILVTGGAGFIGSHIVDRYIELGHSVTVIDDLSAGKKENLNPRCHFINIDITDAKEIEKIIDKEKPEILNHHAAQINLRKSVANPVYDARINILGLLNLLESGIKHNLKKVIFASSGGAIYGEARVLPTPENYEPKLPLTPYGITKMASEQYLRFYFNKYRLPFVILRYSNVYGPRQDPFGEGGVVAIFAQKLLNGEQPIINGDGKQTRDFVYVGDIVTANVLALKKNVNTALNISTGIETSINQFFHLLATPTNSSVAEIHGESKSGDQQRSVLDNTLARTILGWQSKTPLIAGLEKTVRFFENERI